MSTKVFISWSGELSRKLAEALRKWLPASLQYVKPYFSPDDIEKGVRWNSEIANELETSNVGIICLTRDNTEKPWILFEAGALSKTLDKARVCTLLFDLDPSDLKGPLTSFQATRFTAEDFKRLVSTINSTTESRLDQSVLDTVFEMWWPKLEKEVEEIIRTHGKGAKKAIRSERDMLEEVLQLSRMSASRAHRPSRTNPRILSEIIENLGALTILVAKEHEGIASEIDRRIRRSLRYISLETGPLSDRLRGIRDPFAENFRSSSRSPSIVTDTTNEPSEPSDPNEQA